MTGNRIDSKETSTAKYVELLQHNHIGLTQYEQNLLTTCNTPHIKETDIVKVAVKLNK